MPWSPPGASDNQPLRAPLTRHRMTERVTGACRSGEALMALLADEPHRYVRMRTFSLVDWAFLPRP
jgi:hypothetical protein